MTTHKIYKISLLALFFLTAPLMNIRAATIPLDKVIAIVNTGVVTQSQLNDAIAIMAQQLVAAGKPVLPAAELRKKALNQTIGDTLQLQIAERANIKITDADVNRTITNIATQNHLSLDQLKEALKKQGMSYNSYHQQLHNQLLLHTVQQQALAGKINISPVEIEAYVKKNTLNEQTQYHLDDLLIPYMSTSSDVEATNNLAKNLLQKAKQGTSLSQLAGNQATYTDLQWRTTKEIPEIFTNTIAHLKQGGIAGPIKAPNGLHIIQLLGIKGQSMTSEAAKQAIFQEKIQEAADAWTQELRKTAYVKIM